MRVDVGVGGLGRSRWVGRPLLFFFLPLLLPSPSSRSLFPIHTFSSPPPPPLGARSVYLFRRSWCTSFVRSCFIKTWRRSPANSFVFSSRKKWRWTSRSIVATSMSKCCASLDKWRGHQKSSTTFTWSV